MNENQASDIVTPREPKFSLVLIRASDDPPMRSDEYQAELKTFTQSLKANGIEFHARSVTMDSAAGGGFTSGEITIIAGSLVSLSGLLRVWIKTKYGRKVTLKTKDFSAEAMNVKEIEKLVELAEEHRKKAGRK
jgi:hypothetical protein